MAALFWLARGLKRSSFFYRIQKGLAGLRIENQAIQKGNVDGIQAPSNPFHGQHILWAWP